MALTPSYLEERRAPLDWDAQVPVSPRCIAALGFMWRALREQCAAGQPLGPTPAFSTLGAFYAGLEGAARVLVISPAVDEAGWRMAARTRPGPPALRLGGLWSDSLHACWADWMAPQPPPGDPARDIFFHALAAVITPQAAHHGGGLVLGLTILIRSTCFEALHALQHGDFRRPAVQDAAMLLGPGCLDLGLPP